MDAIIYNIKCVFAYPLGLNYMDVLVFYFTKHEYINKDVE